MTELRPKSVPEQHPQTILTKSAVDELGRGDTRSGDYRPSDYDRFSAKYVVTTDGCWLWTSTTCGNTQLYGQFWLDGRRIGAHVASWLLFRGSIDTGLDVMHTCDVPLCVNPDHLETGTRSQNLRHGVARGSWDWQRQRTKGRKLTADDVRAIRTARAAGVRGQILADQYGVSVGLITGIVKGRRWAHIDAGGAA